MIYLIVANLSKTPNCVFMLLYTSFRKIKKPASGHRTQANCANR